MVDTLFDRHRLEGAPNFRDLGGLPAADGKHIKPGRLLRSGHLAYITAADGKALVEDYHLRTVIDLRTEQEMLRRPDTVLPGVQHIHCPIFEQKAEGVTREEAVPNNPAESALRMGRNMLGYDPHERMQSLYGIFLEEEGIRHYTEFFDIILNQTEGAVLWHCTMGKDRCGTGAVLLEIALGVPEDVILEDYLYTNKRLNPITEDNIRQVMELDPDPALPHIIRTMDSVHPDFLGEIYRRAEAQSGSLLNFIQQKLGVDDEKLARLREMYLE